MLAIGSFENDIVEPVLLQGLFSSHEGFAYQYSRSSAGRLQTLAKWTLPASSDRLSLDIPASRLASLLRPPSLSFVARLASLDSLLHEHTKHKERKGRKNTREKG